jgi:Carbohydrate-selective porin, OprB family
VSVVFLHQQSLSPRIKCASGGSAWISRPKDANASGASSPAGAQLRSGEARTEYVRIQRARQVSLRVLAAATALWIVPAFAQIPAKRSGSSEQQNATATPEEFWNRDKMTGDWGGLRKRLEQRGVTFSLSYEGEVLADFAGGIKRGTVYEQEILGEMDADLAKLLNWQGASFHASAYDYAGQGLSQGFVGGLATVSGIEAPPTSVRLFTLWLNQTLLNDRLALKAGILAMDEEQFALTAPGALFVGATFGFPDGMALNLPGGGPTYPLSAPGVLIDGKPLSALDLRVAVFSGDPTGHIRGNIPAARHTQRAYPTVRP